MARPAAFLPVSAVAHDTTHANPVYTSRRKVNAQNIGPSVGWHSGVAHGMCDATGGKALLVHSVYLNLHAPLQRQRCVINKL